MKEGGGGSDTDNLGHWFVLWCSKCLWLKTDKKFNGNLQFYSLVEPLRSDQTSRSTIWRCSVFFAT